MTDPFMQFLKRPFHFVERSCRPCATAPPSAPDARVQRQRIEFHFLSHSFLIIEAAEH